MKKNRQSQTITKRLLINDVEYEICALVTTYTDDRYGADADGNRYISMEFIEDVEVIYCYDNEKKIEDQTIINKLLEKMELV